MYMYVFLIQFECEHCVCNLYLTSPLPSLPPGGVALWQLEDNYHTFTLSQAASGHDDVLSGLSILCDRTKAASSGYDRW